MRLSAESLHLLRIEVPASEDHCFSQGSIFPLELLGSIALPRISPNRAKACPICPASS